MEFLINQEDGKMELEGQNEPPTNQYGTNQIPPTLEPTVLDIRHGLHMPDMPTENVGNLGINDLDSTDIGPNPAADETEYEDANPNSPIGTIPA
jgi:hypothetical protein